LNGRVSGGATVSPAEVSTAMRLAFERLHLVVEPGGAVALAAVLAGKVEATDATVVTLSGGNVDQETFTRLIRA
jgi:threonine dehydratase